MRHCTCKGRYTDEISCGTRPFRKAGKRLVHQLGRGLGGAPRSVRGARRAVPQREGVSCGRPLVAVRRRAHGKRHVRHGRPRETRHAWPPEGGSPGLAAAHAPVVAKPLRTEGDAVGKRLLRVRAGVVPPTGLAEPRLGVEKELRKRLGVFVGRPQVSAAKRVCAVAHGQQGPSARAGVRLSFPWGRVQGRTCPDSSAAPPCPAAVAAGSTRRRSARGVRPARPGRRCAPRGPRGRRCGHAPRGCTACTPCGAGLVPGTVTGVRPGPREPRGVVPGPGPAGHSARRRVRSGRSRGRPPCPGPRSSCRPSRSAHSCRAPCSA